jgi:hypothetical protein
LHGLGLPNNDLADLSADAVTQLFYGINIHG